MQMTTPLKQLICVSNLYIGEVGDTAWRQINLLLGFLRVWLFSDKLSDEVSNGMSLLHFWTPSLL